MKRVRFSEQELDVLLQLTCHAAAFGVRENEFYGFSENDQKAIAAAGKKLRTLLNRFNVVIEIAEGD